jgi:DNA-3-methyladenine glycosylase I
MLTRCSWATTPLSIAYHDDEWGVPVHGDTRLFEFLILEGAQAGLSWETILRKRDNYRAAFDGFNPKKVAGYDERKIAALLQDASIIAAYVWQFVNGKPLKRKPGQPLAARTEISDALSKDLLKRGFKFVGSTICYSFMQAVGMVNDHDSKCFRYRQIK